MSHEKAARFWLFRRNAFSLLILAFVFIFEEIMDELLPVKCCTLALVVELPLFFAITCVLLVARDEDTTLGWFMWWFGSRSVVNGVFSAF